MALRGQPYLPLYVQDILTDEKLIECSASAHGVYFRLMCILHKQQDYGVLCLKEKYKQNPSKCLNFAMMLGKQMPFDVQTISDALEELSNEKVITIDDDSLFQKRMVQDGRLSLMRAEQGKKGGSKINIQANTKANTKAKTQAKDKANAESANESEYVIESVIESESVNTNETEIKTKLPFKEIIEYLNLKANTNYRHTSKKTRALIMARFNDYEKEEEKYTLQDFYTVIDKKVAGWKNTEQEQFLRPETLFSNKFESYLNQRISKPNTTLDNFKEVYNKYKEDENNEQDGNN